MRVFAAVFSLLIFFGASISARTPVNEIETFLDQYVGSWEGRMTIETNDGELIKTIPVAAEYWRSGSSIKGHTAFEIDGSIRFAQSRNYIRNRLLYADVSQDGETTTYRGYLEEGAVLWVPYDAELNSDRRIRESFVEEDGESRLVVEGRELLRSNKGVAKIRLRAELIRDADK